MAQFSYTGANIIRATLNMRPGDKDITLVPGGVYELPEKNTYIRTLVARRLLVSKVERAKKPKRKKRS